MSGKKHFQDHHKEVLLRVRETDHVIPAHRAAFKKGYSSAHLPFDEQLLLWDYVWKNSNEFRPKFHAYLFLEKYISKPELLSAIWKTSVSWQNDVTDWPLCDALAKINSKILEAYPDKVYKQLVAWNKDKDQWKRRQSVVSLLYYSRTLKVHLPYEKIAALIEPLLADKEYYVQKGVGWSLREMGNVYPKQTLAFLTKHIKSISAIAFTIAIEKLDEDAKNKLKSVRR